MKKIICIVSVLCIAFLLFACGEGNTNTETSLSTDTTNMLEDEKIILTGKVAEVNSDTVEMTIQNSEKASGTYVVNVSDQTEIYDVYGNKISLDQIEINDIVDVSFNGQVTKSMPPQINAIIIQVK